MTGDNPVPVQLYADLRATLNDIADGWETTARRLDTILDNPIAEATAAIHRANAAALRAIKWPDHPVHCVPHLHPVERFGELHWPGVRYVPHSTGPLAIHLSGLGGWLSVDDAIFAAARLLSAVWCAEHDGRPGP